MTGPGSRSGGLPGVLRGRYRVVRPLGRGGMGAVYLATDALFGDRPCAIKELLGDPAATPAEAAEATERFAREARLLASLEHPNLPRVHDYFSEQGKSYLVMEFIDGETLEQRVVREGAQSQERVLAWAQEMCAALDYLHAQTPPVIFRDVAPDNMMLDRAGQVKLIDFGIARVFNPSKQTDTLRFGKVGYAPPEQYSGRGQTTPRSDIFALGATLHFALTGRDPADLPFVFPPLRDVNPSVSAEVEQTILSAVQMDPARRPADVRAFAESVGLALPPLALPTPSVAQAVEMASVPARPALPEPRLVVFRPRDMQPQQRRQFRQVRQVMFAVVLLCCFLPVALILGMSFLFSGAGFSFSTMLPFFSVFFPMLLLFPAFIGIRKNRRTAIGRMRVALGRQGLLLLHVGAFQRRKVIPWEDITAVENTVQLAGPRVELRLRRQKPMHPVTQQLYRFLASSANQMRENQSRSAAQWQVTTTYLPVFTPWSVSLAPWFYEQMAPDESPVPAMNLQEAALWYWQEPQRRAALADLPDQGQEREVALLRDEEELKEPVKRWLGVPLWASLAVLTAGAVLTTPFSLWAMPGNTNLFQWFDFPPSSAIGLALSLAGLAVLLAFANRRGWFFKAGALALVVGGVIQAVPYVTATFSFPNFDYDAAYPYVPYNQFLPATSMYLGLSCFVLLFGLVLLFERRERGRSYTSGEIWLLSASSLVFVLMPAVQALVLAGNAATDGYASTALLDLALLPYLPMAVILLCYFQGRSPRMQRFTTLGVLIAGLAMAGGEPLLSLVTTGWLAVQATSPETIIWLNAYWGLQALVGLLIAGAAGRRLYVFGRTQRTVPEVRAAAPALVAAATTVLERSEGLPPGMAD